MRARTHNIQNAHLVERAAGCKRTYTKTKTQSAAVILCDACELLMIKMGQKIISAVRSPRRTRVIITVNNHAVILITT